nr:hypothetical protein TetV2_00348 [Oceanusvirus sp.]
MEAVAGVVFLVGIASICISACECAHERKKNRRRFGDLETAAVKEHED